MKKKSLVVLVFAFSVANFFGQELPALIPFLKGNQFGFVNQKKKMIIPPKFTFAYPFGYVQRHSIFPSYALVQIKNTMYLVDEKGKLIKEEDFLKKNEFADFPPPQMEEMITNTYSVFEKNGKKGVEDDNKKVVLEPVYSDIDIRVFSNSYLDKKTKKYEKPTFAEVSISGKSAIIRLDQFKIYEDLSMAAFTQNSNHMIIRKHDNNSATTNGILLENKLILLNKKYTRINKYFEDSGLVSVDEVIGEHPVNFYIDIYGNAYYEK